MAPQVRSHKDPSSGPPWPYLVSPFNELFGFFVSFSNTIDTDADIIINFMILMLLTVGIKIKDKGKIFLKVEDKQVI